MQIRIFSIPIPGGEALSKEMNTFLRSKKVLQVESQLVNNEQGAFWCFCIKYMENTTGEPKKKVDYKQTLDEASFQRFSSMREIRKKIAREEEIPAFAVFSDQELASLAELKELTASSMKNVKGIGSRKIEKYGKHFFTKKSTKDEES